MKKRLLLVVVCILMFVFPISRVAGRSFVPATYPWMKSDIAKDLFKVRDLFLKGEIKASLLALDEMEKKYPGMPFSSAGKMGIYSLLMLQSRSPSLYERVYMKEYRKNKKVRSMRLWRARSDWPLFHLFYAGSLGVHGFYKIFSGHAFSGMLVGLRGLSSLEDLHHRLPEFVDSLIGIGALKYAKGNLAKALGLGILFGGEKKKAEGLKDIETVAEKGWMFGPFATYTLAFIYAREKKYTKALSEINKLVDVYPGNCVFSSLKVDILLSLKMAKEAIELSSAMLTKECSLPIIHYKMGYAFLLAGDPAAALSHLSLAEKGRFFNLTPSVEFLMGEACRMKGDVKKAVEYYRASLKKYGDRESKKRIRELGAEK